MPPTRPTIWNTGIQKSANIQRIDFHIDGDHVVRLEISRILRDGRAALPKEQVPDYIHFTVYNLPSSRKDNMPDLFLITGGIRVVSERFRDLLMAHELGATEFYEVPLYEYDQTTRRPGRWFFLSVIETKPTLIPEQSTGIKGTGAKGVYRPDVAAPREVYAVRAASAEGADLWRDPALHEQLFLTDRLKRAIKEAGIKARRMTMRKCVVVA
jgi:hypothetical protein